MATVSTRTLWKGAISFGLVHIPVGLHSAIEDKRPKFHWAEEVRDMVGLPLPGDAEAMGLTEREMKMGEQLVLDMAEPWSPERFRDEFTEKVEALGGSQAQVWSHHSGGGADWRRGGGQRGHHRPDRIA